MIIGIDFGTTNTRIAAWEPEVGGLPALKMFKSGMTTMPSVISFRRKARGGAEIEAIGEDADGLGESTATREVIRNIKRWALASDPFVRRVLENSRSTRWPKYWNPGQRSIELWGQSIAISEIIMGIINQALKRVGLENISSELRAACPVHSDYSYRRDMVDIFSEGGFVSKLTGVTEEPLLFLALAYSQGRLDEGSYLVYDFGGGSFDCALATVERQHGVLNLIVYAADGDPLLGGMDVDEMLKTKLAYDGPPHLLRLAKEAVCRNPSGPSQLLKGGIRLSISDVEDVLREGNFVGRTLDVMMSVYRQAKMMWKRPPDSPPLGENLEVDSNGMVRRTIWKLREHDLASDIDKVLLFGGTTRIPYVVQELENIFGSKKVVTASQLLTAFREPELTAVALGAAYPPREQYTPLYVSRLPCRMTLRVRQGSGEQKAEYVPFSRLPISRPPRPWISETLAIASSSSESAKYEVTVEDPDGKVLRNIGPLGVHMPDLIVPAKWLRIVVDRFGRIWLDMMTGKENDRWHETVELLEIPPWQTSAQRTALERTWKMVRENKRAEHARVVHVLTHNPYGWGVDVG
jgi:hypothetical protein